MIWTHPNIILLPKSHSLLQFYYRFKHATNFIFHICYCKIKGESFSDMIWNTNFDHVGITHSPLQLKSDLAVLWMEDVNSAGCYSTTVGGRKSFALFCLLCLCLCCEWAGSRWRESPSKNSSALLSGSVQVAALNKLSWWYRLPSPCSRDKRYNIKLVPMS